MPQNTHTAQQRAESSVITDRRPLGEHVFNDCPATGGGQGFPTLALEHFPPGPGTIRIPGTLTLDKESATNKILRVKDLRTETSGRWFRDTAQRK